MRSISIVLLLGTILFCESGWATAVSSAAESQPNLESFEAEPYRNKRQVDLLPDDNILEEFRKQAACKALCGPPPPIELDSGSSGRQYITPGWAGRQYITPGWAGRQYATQFRGYPYKFGLGK